MVTFGGAVVNVGNSLVNDCGVVVQVVVQFALVNQLGMVRVCRLDFHRHFQVCLGVNGLVNLSKGTFIDLPDDLEVFAYLLKHLGHWDSVIKNN
jgi:hypothetical protein